MNFKWATDSPAGKQKERDCRNRWRWREEKRTSTDEERRRKWSSSSSLSDKKWRHDRFHPVRHFQHLFIFSFSTRLSTRLCRYFFVLFFCFVFLRSYSIFLLLSIVLAVLFSIYLILNFLFFLLISLCSTRLFWTVCICFSCCIYLILWPSSSVSQSSEPKSRPIQVLAKKKNLPRRWPNLSRRTRALNFYMWKTFWNVRVGLSISFFSFLFFPIRLTKWIVLVTVSDIWSSWCTHNIRFRLLRRRKRKSEWKNRQRQKDTINVIRRRLS